MRNAFCQKLCWPFVLLTRTCQATSSALQGCTAPLPCTHFTLLTTRPETSSWRAGSPIYDFLRSGQLNLSQHDRRRMSGQVEAHGHNWRALQAAFLARQAQQQARQPQAQPVVAGVVEASSIEAALQQQQQQQQVAGDGRWQPAGPEGWPGASAPLNVDAAVAAMQHPQAAPTVVPPYAPPDEATTHAFNGRSGSKPMRAWTAEDLRLAAGSSLMRDGSGSLVARHPLQLASAYSSLTGSESSWSTAHDKFVGTVDYIWYTPAATGSTSWQLTPLRVLQVRGMVRAVMAG